MRTIRISLWIALLGVALPWTTVGSAAPDTDPALRWDADWHAYVDAAHQASIEQSVAQAHQASAAVPGDAYGPDDLKQANALLDLPRRALAFNDVIGHWRCRSIQVGNLGTFAYPYFKCQIVRHGDGLYFEKLSGSQRRTGWLYRNGEGFALLGGNSVNEDSPMRYSGLPSGASTESDTLGSLQGLPDGRLLIVFDATPQSYELYELVRQ
jgi:Domain of unknown function (DUF4893)